MSHDILIQYFDEIEAHTRNLENVYVEKYEEEIVTSSRANLRMRFRFKKGSLLEFNEAIVVEARSIKHLYYRLKHQLSPDYIIRKFYKIRPRHFKELYIKLTNYGDRILNYWETINN